MTGNVMSQHPRLATRKSGIGKQRILLQCDRSTKPTAILQQCSFGRCRSVFLSRLQRFLAHDPPSHRIVNPTGRGQKDYRHRKEIDLRDLHLSHRSTRNMANDAKPSLITRLKWWPFSRKRKFADINTSKNTSSNPSRSSSAGSTIDKKNTTPTTPISDVVGPPSKRVRYTPRYAERDALLSIPKAPRWVPSRTRSSKSALSMPARYKYDFVGSGPAAFRHPNSRISLERQSHARRRENEDWNTPLSAYSGRYHDYGRSNSLSSGAGAARPHRSRHSRSTPHLRSEVRKSDIPAVPALPNVGSSEPDSSDTPASAALAKKRNKRYSAWRASHCAQQGDEEHDQRLAWEMAEVSLSDAEYEEGYEDYDDDPPLPLSEHDIVPPWSSRGLLPNQSPPATLKSSSAVGGEMNSGACGKAIPALQKVATARNFSRPESPLPAPTARPATPTRYRTKRNGKGRANGFVSPIERLRSESPSSSFGPPPSPPPSRALPGVPTPPEAADERPRPRMMVETAIAPESVQVAYAAQTDSIAPRRDPLADTDVIDFALPPPISQNLIANNASRHDDDEFDEEERICSRMSSLDFGTSHLSNDHDTGQADDDEQALASGASTDGRDIEERDLDTSLGFSGSTRCMSPAVIRDADNGMGGWF